MWSFRDQRKGDPISATPLLLRPLTYDLMASYWSSPEALKNDPVVAQGIDNASKSFFPYAGQSRVGEYAACQRQYACGIRKLKQQDGKDLAILGSGAIVAQLAQAGLIDEYQIMLNPVVLGKGKTMFEGIENGLFFEAGCWTQYCWQWEYSAALRTVEGHGDGSS